MNEKVDIVLPWLNPHDNSWYNDYCKETKTINGDKHKRTIRDMGTLKYIFRGIEKNAPWVNNIHVLLYSENQIPDWFNLNNPKLKIHFHKDFIPSNFLPTFNNLVIEAFINKIPGLTNNFILINDDMFFCKSLSVEDFFINGVPTDNPKLTDVIASNPVHEYKLHKAGKTIKNQTITFFGNIVKNSLNLAQKVTGKKVLYHNFHAPLNITKSQFNKYFNILQNDIYKSCENSKIRTTHNIVSWLYRYIRLNNAEYVQTDFLTKDFKFMELSKDDFKEIIKYIQTYKILVINDMIDDEHVFKIASEHVNKILEAILPNKCSYEK